MGGRLLSKSIVPTTLIISLEFVLTILRILRTPIFVIKSSFGSPGALLDLHSVMHRLITLSSVTGCVNQSRTANHSGPHSWIRAHQLENHKFCSDDNQLQFQSKFSIADPLNAKNLSEHREQIGTVQSSDIATQDFIPHKLLRDGYPRLQLPC